MKKFTYNDTHYLNTLVMYVDGENSKLSATLMPDIPEFIDAATRTNFFNKSPGIIEYERWESPADENSHTLLMLQLCNKYHIMPFWRFGFDNNPSQWGEPHIKYIGPRAHSIYDKPYHICVHPIFFMQDRKWYQMIFENYQGDKSVNAAKVAISAAIQQGYVVTYLYAGLNPRIRTADHYCDYEICDAELWASNGIVEASNVPDNFELPKEPRKIDAEAEYLENFIAGFLQK